MRRASAARMNRDPVETRISKNREVRGRRRVQAELGELMKTLAADGCAVLRIRDNTSVVLKRVGLPENSVDHFAEKGREPRSGARGHRQTPSDTDDLWRLCREGKTQVSTDYAQHCRHEQAHQPAGAQEDSEGNHPRDGCRLQLG